MKIYELEEGTEVTLIILFEEKTLNLKTTCVGTKGKDLLVAALRMDGKVLNLGVGDVKVGLMIERDKDKPLMWAGCDVKMMMAKNNVLMRISCKSEAKEVNRRDNFRLSIGGQAKARIGKNKDAIQLILRDVSYSGFAVLVEGLVKCEVGNPIRTVYKDEELETVLDLRGKIVRIAEHNGRKLLGCKLDLPSPVLGKYIGEKQQKILANRSGNTPINDKK